MGIHGRGIILEHIVCGAYNKRGKKRALYVDGELVRYRGMCQDNMNKYNAESEIAMTSFGYLKNLKSVIETHICEPIDTIVVYLDGRRLVQKVKRPTEERLNQNLVRDLFKELCTNEGYTVNQLANGESELQMYLKRNKENDLNIFLTNDSDMISICYGHKPTINQLINQSVEEWLSENAARDVDMCNPLIYNAIENNSIEKKRIVDNNRIYMNAEMVRDSCLWIDCASNQITAFGMDFIDELLKFQPTQFRTFVALCGTDYTRSLLTKTQIKSIMMSSDSDRNYLNNLNGIHHIVAILMVIGMKYGGTLNRLRRTTHTPPIDKNQFIRSIQQYIEYMITGLFDAPDDTSAQDMSIVAREYLYAMKGENDDFKKKTLSTWANRISYDECLNNLDSFGVYAPYLNSRREKESLEKPTN